MLQVTINGQPHSLMDGLTINEALRLVGVEIPTLCHDDRIDPYGSCRTCAVEVKGMNALVTACNTQIREGMEIQTHSPTVEGVRKTLFGLLAANYPAEAVAAFPDKQFHRYLKQYGVKAGGSRTAPPPEVPPTDSLPAPGNPMNPMKRYMSPQMSSGEMAGPTCGCNTPGYWIPDYEFPMMGKWIGGAEFLLVRPHLTRDSAFETTPNGGGGAETQNVNFNAPYEAALRAFIGWQINCDQSLRFTYTYIFDDKSRSADVPAGSVITSPIGASLNPGDSIKATQHLRLQTWDIDNVRKLELPGMGCDTCSAWEANWSWGVRIIDVEETILNDVTGPDAETLTQKSSFVGAGPRIGFELRRQLGQTRMLGFVGADAGLLLGGQNTVGSNTPTGFNSAQIVPDFDLRLGVCWQPRPDIAISTGWMFETFGDAIMLNQDASLATLSRPQASSLSYDGLFLRGEFHF